MGCYISLLQTKKTLVFHYIVVRVTFDNSKVGVDQEEVTPPNWPDHWVAHWSWELMSSVGRSFFLEEASGILKALCTCMLGGTLGIEKSSWVTLESATKYHFFKIELTAIGIQYFFYYRCF